MSLICDTCREKVREILRSRMEDILAVQENDSEYPGSSHCFHLMEIERMLDGKPTAFPKVKP